MSAAITEASMSRERFIHTSMNQAASTSIMSANRPLSYSVIRKIKHYPSFYQKVWLACACIPAGKVMTYKELAAAIGHPGAARAVGTALSKNPCAPVIPCHRVIKSDGSVGKYSGPGGTARKRQLLKKEQWTGD
jgi:methylated-DNA-[protein]-cysteine S-methyltransferase